MMTEKEKDLQICKELTEIANDVFNKYCAAVPAGVYSVADLLKKQGGKYGTSYADMIECAFMEAANKEGFNIFKTVCVDSFRCEFSAGDVFRILAQFEKLAGVTTANRAKFCKEDKSEEILRVYVDIQKASACVADFTACDDLRPVMNNILLDLKTSQAFAVASDSKMLCSVPVCASLVSGDLLSDGAGVLVPCNVWKKICGAGACEIVATAKNDKYNITALRDGVAVASGLVPSGRFPNWRAVLPRVGASFVWSPEEMKKHIKNAAKSVPINKTIKFDLLGDAVRVHAFDIDKKTGYDITAEMETGDVRGRLSFLSENLVLMAKNFDGRAYVSSEAGKPAFFGLKCGGFALIMQRLNDDILPPSLVWSGASLDYDILEVDAVPVPAKASKKTKKAEKLEDAASVEAVAVAAYPCTAGERCDVYEGAPVRELLAVYDSAEGCAVSPDLLPVLASAAPVVDLSPMVEEYENVLKAVEILKRSISRGLVSSDVLASAGLASVASAPDVSPVVGSSRPSASVCDRFRVWCRSLAAAVVALLAWCGLSLSSCEPSEAAPVDGDSVAAVVILPAVECVAVVPGVALPDVVCIGDAVPLELPSVDCVASSPARFAVAAVTAQDLAACGSSGGLSSPVVASVAVPAVVPGLVSSPSVFASL